MAHPNTTMLVVSRRTGQRPAAVHDQYDSLLQKLCAAGFSPERALLALVSLEMLAAGSAIEEANMGPNTQFAPVDPRKYPTLFKIAQGAKLHVRTSFAQMCHLILMGLKDPVDCLAPSHPPQDLSPVLPATVLPALPRARKLYINPQLINYDASYG
jgi:hypothetical protein